jgi:hypothetical protein
MHGFFPNLAALLLALYSGMPFATDHGRVVVTHARAVFVYVRVCVLPGRELNNTKLKPPEGKRGSHTSPQSCGRLLVPLLRHACTCPHVLQATFHFERLLRLGWAAHASRLTCMRLDLAGLSCSAGTLQVCHQEAVKYVIVQM